MRWRADTAFSLRPERRRFFHHITQLRSSIPSVRLPPRSQTRTVASVLPSAPRVFPSSGFVDIGADRKIEEEEIPTYKPENHYPAYTGEVFNSRYQIVSKIGFGVQSPFDCVVISGKDQYDWTELEANVPVGSPNTSPSSYVSEQNRTVILTHVRIVN